VDFPDTKSGRQMRALGSAAVELIAAQSTKEWSRYVFPSELVDKPITTTPACLARLCHLADIERVTPHVLRHTYASVAADLGFSELTIAALLGHSARGITQAYIHIDDAAKLAADRVSKWIEARLSLDA
jgi:integrase